MVIGTLIRVHYVGFAKSQAEHEGCFLMVMMIMVVTITVTVIIHHDHHHHHSNAEASRNSQNAQP